MSHDFPDGPDYNPEPIDDDPWDVDTTSAPPEITEAARHGQPRLPDDLLVLCNCGVLDHGLAYHAYSCAAMLARNSPQDATDADFRPTDR